MKEFTYEWYWCETCRTSAIKCPACGNNCCNGGYGKASDGSECPYCPLAYQYQELGWITGMAPKSPDSCVGVWPKVEFDDFLVDRLTKKLFDSGAEGNKGETK